MKKFAKNLGVRYYVHTLTEENMSPRKTISITDARKNIFKMAKEIEKPDVQYVLTENGKEKMVVLSAEEYYSLMETVEIISDSKIMGEIKLAEKEYKEGKYVPLEEFLQKEGYLPGSPKQKSSKESK